MYQSVNIKNTCFPDIPATLTYRNLLSDNTPAVQT